MPACSTTAACAASPALVRFGKPDGHLHLLRSGRMRIHLSDGKIMPVQGPSLICFPRGVKHRFFVADGEAVELTCASLQFQGGAHNPHRAGDA